MDSQKNTNQEWYETWFDSPYYHILYKDRDLDEAANFLSQLCDFLHPEINSRFLDIACGKGRHSNFLASRGYNVTGVDLSPQNIEEAIRQNQYENAQYYTRDMRINADLGLFDYILNLFTSFGYFEQTEDNIAALTAVREQLTDNGIFVLDFLNVPFARRQLQPHSRVELDGIEFDQYRKVENGYFVKDIQFTDAGRQHHFTERVQALELEDFESMFADCGLEIKQLFGNYQMDNYQPLLSPRLIILACKS